MTNSIMSTFKMGGKVFLRLILVTVMCAMTYMSMSVISSGVLSREVGYQILEQTAEDKVEVIEEHYYSQGEEIRTAEDFELEENQFFNKIREVSDLTNTIVDAITQVLMLIMVAAFPYNVLWELGNRDDTNVRYRGHKADPWRGVKIGAIATIPYALLWLGLVVAKYGLLPDSYLAIYRLLALPYMPITNWVMGAATTAADAALWRLLLLLPTLLFVPVVCGIAYRLGGQRFSVKEFLTFAKRADEGEDTSEI